MRFAMRLPELTTEQLRRATLKEEFSTQYEATLPFYRNAQDLKPASPAKLPQPAPFAPPQGVVSEPVAAEHEAESREEVDSCTTTPEQTQRSRK
jgi:hypothetical protein